jgi:hypothetical protein
MEEQTIAKKVQDIISAESKKTENKIILEDVNRILTDMREAGVLKTTHYNIPQKDTIGKDYYLHLKPLT